MPETDQITLTLRPDQITRLEEMANDGNPRYRSKSEAARHLLDRVEEIDELEKELDRLKSANKVIIDRYETSDMRVSDGDENNDSGILGRLSWLLRGR